MVRFPSREALGGTFHSDASGLDVAVLLPLVLLELRSPMVALFTRYDLMGVFNVPLDAGEKVVVMVNAGRRLQLALLYKGCDVTLAVTQRSFFVLGHAGERACPCAVARTAVFWCL